jgi:hypothetical protein
VYLEIDHYVPKTADLALAFEWLNLFPACQVCNTSKGGRDHGNLLIKPDRDEPEEYFWIDPDSGELQPRSNLNAFQRRQAEVTVQLCGLQRGRLCERRVELLGRVRRWLRQISACEGDLSPVLQEEWQSLAQPTAEFKLVLRHELRRLGAPELADEDKRRFEAPPAATLD